MSVMESSSEFPRWKETPPDDVIPAAAGIQCRRSWVPACAGTTAVVIAALALFVADDAHARSRAPVRAFVDAVPCPSTGLTGGKCPGYVVDHVVPLCAGGADDPANMQWQARADSYAKDRAELALCRWIRRAKQP